MTPAERAKERIIGRYALYGEIAAGGMATVHYGRMVGAVGFSRTVAIKCLHPQFAKDADFVSMFLDEARLAARIQHPNVVQTLDVVALEGELFIVMEYIRGDALARLSRAARRSGELIPPRVTATIISGLLHGLHAAHEASDEHGRPLGIVHRDVSPQNVLVGTDGVSRVLDFGVAKAAGRLSSTREGQLKGKFAYMAPEQVRGETIDRRCDIYAAAVILWETLTGRRMISGENEAIVLSRVLEGQRTRPTELNPNLSKAVDVVTLRGLEMDPAKRYATAREMAIALERAIGLASQREVSEWVERVAGDVLAERALRIKEIESRSTVSTPQPGLVSELIATARNAEQQAEAATQFYQSGSSSQVSGVSLQDPPSQPSALHSAITAPEYPVPGEPVSSASRGNATIVTQTPRSVNIALLALGGVALLFAGVATAALVVLARDRSSPPPTAAVPLAATATMPVATTGAPPAGAPPTGTAMPTGTAGAQSGAALPSASAAASEKPPAAAATTTATAPNTAPPATATAPRPAATPRPPAPPKGDCDIPYTIDASGIKRPKAHCF
jgi:serine/threonine protein kinase